MSASWPDTPEALEALQRRIAEEADRSPPWRPPSHPLIGAVFAATRRGLEGAGAPGDPAWVAAVAGPGWAIVRGRLEAPYIPGLLALREGRVLERAVRALDPLPDVLIVNATGRDHPRRAGLTVHLGWALGIPTIGVTDRLLAGGEGALRCGPGRGVWVHAGWRIDVETALGIVAPLQAERTPAPLREARRLARAARAALG